jgi:ABC-type oligopeptide transport system substrate-binding subunit
MKRRIRYMALVLVLCMLALTGCAQPRDTMTLRVCLDPAMASSDAERTVVAHLFENLMKLSRGEDGGIQPVYAAAKSYTVEDNLDGTETYTFTLRQNVRWSDGQTVTAHDFVYGWRTRPPAPPMRLCWIWWRALTRCRPSRTEAFFRYPPRTTSPSW